MNKKSFFEEVALACKDEANAIRQTMYLIMNSEVTIQKTRELMVDSIVAKFIEKIDDPKLIQLFNSKIGYTDREFSSPAEKTIIYELIMTSLSFPETGKRFALKPAGHIFREENLVGFLNDYESIPTSPSFPEMGRGFMLKPVGHYFKEDDLVEIFNDFDSFALAICKMNENFGDQTIIKTFKGPNTRGGKVIELYLVGGLCLAAEVKKISKPKN